VEISRINSPGIGTNTICRLGGVGVQYIFFFLTALLVSRCLGKDSLGDFFLAVTILNIIGYSCTFGLKQGVVRYTAIYSAREDKSRLRGTIILSLSMSFVSGVAGAFLLFYLSPWLALEIFHSPMLEPVLKIIAFAIPFLSAFNVLVSGLQGLKNIRAKVLLENIMIPGLAFLLAAAFFLLLCRLSGWPPRVGQGPW